MNDIVWTKESLLAMLDRNKLAVARALWTLYQRQTTDEQATNTTRVHNGRGFNSRDAEFLSDVAKRLPQYSFNLTDRQLHRVRAQIRKYWRQLLEEIEQKGGKVDFGKARKRESRISHHRESGLSRPHESATSGFPAEYGMF